MVEAIDKAGLAALSRRIKALERAGGRQAPEAVLPFAVLALDRALPGGGLDAGVLHEVSGAGGDEEDGAAAAGFLAGILTRLGPPRPVLWCLAGDDLYGPGLAVCGLDPKRLICVRARDDRGVLGAMEEGLRVPALAAVVGEVGKLPLTASRRLLLAAAKSGITAFALRRWRSGVDAAAERSAPVAAATRWRVSALPSRRGASRVLESEPGVGRPLWRVELLRCRGGNPAQWIMEASDATGHVSLAAELADRAASPARRAALPFGPTHAGEVHILRARAG